MTHGRIGSKLGGAAAALALALVVAPAAARAQGPADDFERGKQLLAQGDAKGVAELLKRAAESRKTDADAWYFYGQSLNASGDGGEARKAFGQALRLRPDAAEAHAGLAAALLMLGKTSEAEREASRALALDGKIALAHYVVGAAQARSGNYRRAAQAAEAALGLRANFYAAALLLGDALLKLYAFESELANSLHPMPPDANEETRKPVFEKREAALAPFKARMLAAAERLEALAASLPGSGLPHEAREMAQTLRVYGGEPHGQSAQVLRQAQVTRKALITYKPAPGYTEEARRNNVRGVVRLRAVLGDDGRIRNILVIRGLPDGLSEQAIQAARQIKFTPAVKDGRPVSQFVILEYNFNDY